MNVEEDVHQLVKEIHRLGTKNADGQTSVTFGVLFKDDRCANMFEALVGTLRAAKRMKIIKFEGEMLFQGVHDNVEIVLFQQWDGYNDQAAVEQLWVSSIPSKVYSFVVPSTLPLGRTVWGSVF